MPKYKIDMHTHTISSGHAYSTITENAKYAASIGLEMIGMTDHAPKMPGSCGYLHFLNMKILPEYIEGIRVLKGIELNMISNEGKVDMKNNILKRLDYAIASLHIPCIDPMDIDECTQTVVSTIKNPFVTIIGHPGDPRYPIDVKTVVACARDNNTLLEINNASFNPGNSRQGGESIVIELLEECKKQSLPVILGSDAHYHTQIGNFNNIMPLLEQAAFPDELIINTKPEEFLSFVEENKKRR